MSQTQSAQIGPAIRIAGLATACLFFLLISAIFGIPSIIVLLVVCIFTASIILPPLTRLIASRLGHLDPFSPSIIFPIAYMLWFVLGSINFIKAPSTLAFGYFDPIPSWMYALYAYGLIGYFCGLGFGRVLRVAAPPPPRRQITPAKMNRILWLMVAATVVTWAIMSAMFGIPLLHPETANADRLAHRGAIYQLFIYLAWTLIIFCPVWTWARGTKKRYDWIMIAAVPSLISVLIVLAGASRAPLVIPLVTLIVARSFLKHQPIWKLATVAAVGFATLSTLGYFRGMLSSTSAPEVSLLEFVGVPPALAPVADMSIDLRFSVGALRDLTKIVPSSIPFQHGAMTLLPLTTFLPGHRDMSDIVFKNMLGHDFEGAGEPATILGPLYVDFGWTGVFLGMCLYGVLLSWTYQRMKFQPTAPRIITYAWWMQNCLWGIFCNGFINVYVILLPLFWQFIYALAKSDTLPSQPVVAEALSA